MLYSSFWLILPWSGVYSLGDVRYNHIENIAEFLFFKLRSIPFPDYLEIDIRNLQGKGKKILG